MWAREQDESSGEEEELEEGGGVTWETQAMEVKGQLISTPGEMRKSGLTSVDVGQEQ